MKIFILWLFIQIGINSVYCTYIGNFFTSNYDKLNDEMKEIRTYINYLENKLNYTENLIKVINITNKPMKDEIQNEVHRRMGIFYSKINNTSHHNYQIETKLNNFEELISKKVEHLITNRSYQNMRIYQNYLIIYIMKQWLIAKLQELKNFPKFSILIFNLINYKSIY